MEKPKISYKYLSSTLPLPTLLEITEYKHDTNYNLNPSFHNDTIIYNVRPLCLSIIDIAPVAMGFIDKFLPLDTDGIFAIFILFLLHLYIILELHYCVCFHMTMTCFRFSCIKHHYDITFS